jgi:allose kinase
VLEKLRADSRGAADIIADFGVKAGNVSAIGVGVPGTLSRDCREIRSTPNLPELNGRRLAEELERRCGAAVFMENDAVMLLFGALNVMKIQNSGVILGVFVGTGLGSALFLDGVPHKGKTGAGSELGHAPLFGQTRKCGCGNIGCAETVASGTALERLRRERYPLAKPGDIFSFLSQGERREFTDALSCAVAAAAQLIDPDIILFGGGVAEMRGFPFEEIRSALYGHTMKPSPADTLDVRLAPRSGELGVTGAALYAENMLAGTGS